MSKILIEAFPKEKKPVPDIPYLNVSEFYMDTIQGEGIYAGVPAAFLRLQGCKVGCKFCDTKEVWREGNPYSIQELFEIIQNTDLPDKLKNRNHHLVITGGSPLLQQENLLVFLEAFEDTFYFHPFTEIENECSIIPSDEILSLIDCWNNSPKLFNSGVLLSHRYNEKAIAKVVNFGDEAWFKFVISDESDWDEISDRYIRNSLISPSKIILMPEGATPSEIAEKREMVIDIAIKYGVRYSTREHIMVWGKKTGV